MANELPLTQAELNHYTNLWCREKGIHSKDLESHPRADDLVFLIKIKEGIWSDITLGNKKSWECIWDWCYHLKKPLKAKHIKKLEHISINAYNTSKFKAQRKAEQRQRIKALRQNPTVATQNKISAENIAAKDAGLAQTVPWE